jgi:hypothetical protein
MTLACRLIRASHLAYAISADGKQLVDSPETQADLDVTGYLKGRLTISQPAGRDGVDAFLFGRTRKNEYLLAFRGTLAPSLPSEQDFFRVLQDWLADGKIELRTGSELAGQVHRGFLESLDHLWPGLEQLLTPAVRADLREGMPLYVTGHSKGAAVAQLAAYRLAQRGIRPSAVYTFAGPRPGDAAFAAAFEATFPGALRFEHRDDLVPHVPPATGSWLSVLKGLRAINLNFPFETPHGSAGSGLSRALDDLVTRLESDLPVYASCGQLQFIDWRDDIQPDSRELTITRNVNLAKAVAEFRLSEILADHSSGGGYCRVPCAATDPAP